MADLSKLTDEELLDELRRAAFAGEWVAYGMAQERLRTGIREVERLTRERDEWAESERVVLHDLESAETESDGWRCRALAAEAEVERLRGNLTLIERMAVHTKTHGRDSDPRCVLCIARAALNERNEADDDLA